MKTFRWKQNCEGIEMICFDDSCDKPARWMQDGLAHTNPITYSFWCDEHSAIIKRGP